MSKAMTEEDLAVKSGYWFDFRFDPSKAENKFTLDSKAPTEDYKEFLVGENRYASLKKFHPEKAEVYFEKGAQGAKERYTYLNKLVTLYAD